MTSAATVALTLAVAVGVVSCGGLGHPRDAGQVPLLLTENPYLETSADALIAYAASLTRLNAVERACECHRVLETYRSNRQLPILFHLFVAQGGAFGCGDSRSTAREVAAMRGQITEATLRNFLDFQRFNAGRLSDGAAEIQGLENALRRARANLREALSKHRQSISQVRDTYRRMKSRDAVARQLKQQVDELKSVEQGLSQSVRSRDAEARQLKEKLDALKSIEQEINETEMREDHD